FGRRFADGLRGGDSPGGPDPLSDDPACAARLGGDHPADGGALFGLSARAHPAGGRLPDGGAAAVGLRPAVYLHRRHLRPVGGCLLSELCRRLCVLYHPVAREEEVELMKWFAKSPAPSGGPDPHEKEARENKKGSWRAKVFRAGGY